MNEYMNVVAEALTASLHDMIISGARGGSVRKVSVRPVMIRGSLFFQLARYTQTQVFHENLEREAALETIAGLLQHDFRQALIRTPSQETTLLISKKGKATVKTRRKAAEEQPEAPAEHDRKKSYILPEGTCVPFLQDLGVMTADGKVVRKRYDKYRQINRYLEFVEDILPELASDRELTIIDFGCGKSYLTFAVYYYLTCLCGRNVRMIGLDLKEDVIARCNELAVSYGYEKLHFYCGDIAGFEGEKKVDMVMTLHACDTATDLALAKAMAWQAQVILSVPCCQHELNQKMDCEVLRGAFRYGIIKERTAALMTDAMRAQLMELNGYQTQLLEFIDMTHTPKNILIRAVRTRKLLPAAQRRKKEEEYLQCRELFHAAPLLEKLIGTDREGADHA